MRGTLPAVHIGRRVRIKRSDFDRLVEEGYGRGKPGPDGDTPSIWDGEIPLPELP
jgi:hypothetical protein